MTTHTETTHTETIAHAIEGNEVAQRALYEAHHAPAFRLAYLLLRDTCDAEEVVQDAFIYAFLNLRRYDPDRGSFWAWLRVILVSRCRNKRRRRSLSLVSLDVLAAGQPLADRQSSGDPEVVLEQLGARRAVWDALQQVSPGARDALVLRYYEELGYDEIASILGCSAAAARARVAHAKVQLRKLLTAPGEESLSRPGALGAAKVV